MQSARVGVLQARFVQGPYTNDDVALPKPAVFYRRQINQYIKEVTERGSYRGNNSNALAQIKRSMEWVFGREASLFCVDIEAWERNTELVTEIGISIYTPLDQESALTPTVRTYHIIIEEHKNKRNGRYVPDHMNNFLEGESLLLSLGEAKDFLRALIHKYFVADTRIPCMFVGHDLKNDIDYLEKIGIAMPERVLQLDTQKLYACSHGKYGSSLQNALRTVKQPFSFLHNAGNDAYFTIMLALKLCDPTSRRVLQLDEWAGDIAPGERREYLKTPKHVSATRRADYRDLFRSIGPV